MQRCSLFVRLLYVFTTLCYVKLDVSAAVVGTWFGAQLNVASPNYALQVYNVGAGQICTTGNKACDLTIGIDMRSWVFTLQSSFYLNPPGFFEQYVTFNDGCSTDIINTSCPIQFGYQINLAGNAVLSLTSDINKDCTLLQLNCSASPQLNTMYQELSTVLRTMAVDCQC